MNTDEELREKLQGYVISAYTAVTAAMHIAVDLEDNDLDELDRARSILRNFVKAP